MNIGDKVYIRDDAYIGQDHGVTRWKGGSVLFKINNKRVDIDRYRLCADGYGNPGNYGNGAIFVDGKDLLLAFPSPEATEANQPGDDFRSHTCGECAWSVVQRWPSANPMFCRRSCFGCTGVSETDGLPTTVNEIAPSDRACPAFVPREKGETK